MAVIMHQRAAISRSQFIEIMNYEADGAVIGCELQQNFSR
jgi:hypothetical protein